LSPKPPLKPPLKPQTNKADEAKAALDALKADPDATPADVAAAQVEADNATAAIAAAAPPPPLPRKRGKGGMRTLRRDSLATEEL